MRRGGGGLIGEGLTFLFLALVVVLVLLFNWARDNPLWAAVLYPGAIWFCWHWRQTAKRMQLETMDARLRGEHVPSMSPREYELFVARQLERAGWSVLHIGKAGDQGCDVLAELRGFKVVVQCKLWRKRCGNSAVQEVVAARHHYGAQVMAVVCPAGYTKSAQALAASNGVHLIGHADLPMLETSARIP